MPEELEGERLDRALAALGLCPSRRGAKEALVRGSVYLDGRRIRVASRLLRAGARLRVEAFPARPGPPVPLRILWEEPGLAALDKPGGVPLAPTRAAVEGSLLHALSVARGLPLSALHPAHRLDTPTSGVVLVALCAAEAARLGGAFREGGVRKTYLAWVHGRPDPPEGLWDWALTEARGGVVRVRPDGRPARTRYHLVREEGARSLLRLEPETGRTHQLRVHCAAAGLPIVGDRKYGRGPDGVKRALLHAWRLDFPRADGGRQVVEAPVPPDMG